MMAPFERLSTAAPAVIHPPSTFTKLTLVAGGERVG